jgi:hypothetical protein
MGMQTGFAVMMPFEFFPGCLDFERLSFPMNRMTFSVERFSLTRRRFAMARQALSLARSYPLARLLRNLRLRQILFAASQAAQISRWARGIIGRWFGIV